MNVRLEHPPRWQSQGVNIADFESETALFLVGPRWQAERSALVGETDRVCRIEGEKGCLWRRIDVVTALIIGGLIARGANGSRVGSGIEWNEGAVEIDPRGYAGCDGRGKTGDVEVNVCKIGSTRPGDKLTVPVWSRYDTVVYFVCGFIQDW